MKKNLLIAFALFVSILVYAEDFAGENVELYRGKTIEVTDPSFGRNYQNYYSKFDKKNLRLDKTNPKVQYNPTKGTQWVVKEIYKDKLFNDYILELISGKSVVYYNYNKAVKRSLEFKVIGGLDIPEGFYCDDFTYTEDKFSNLRVYTSKPTDGFTISVGFRVVDGEKYTAFHLHKNTIGRSCEVGKKGFIMLLENGDKIEKPDAEIEVNVNPTGSAYVYSVDIPLTDEDLQKLSQYRITDTKTYIFTSQIDEGEKIMHYIKCAMKKEELRALFRNALLVHTFAT